MELRHDALHFNPALPAHLKALKIHVRYRGHSLAVEVRDGTLGVHSMTAGKEPINIGCGSERRPLRPGESLSFDLA